MNARHLPEGPVCLPLCAKIRTVLGFEGAALVSFDSVVNAFRVVTKVCLAEELLIHYKAHADRDWNASPHWNCFIKEHV